VIGNDQDTLGGGMTVGNAFGGEIYKLNFFSKELSSNEVEEMAEDQCNLVEETYGDTRHVKWEDILSKSRNRNVTEIENGCTNASYITQFLKMAKKRAQTKIELKETIAELQQTESRLNDTIEELDRSNKMNDELKDELLKKGKQLNDTIVELHQSNKINDDLEDELLKRGKQLNDLVGKIHDYEGELKKLSEYSLLVKQLIQIRTLHNYTYRFLEISRNY
jgi:chromosome segregation ATPase